MARYEVKGTIKCIRREYAYFDKYTEHADGLMVGYDSPYPKTKQYAYVIRANGFEHPEGLSDEELEKVFVKIEVGEFDGSAIKRYGIIYKTISDENDLEEVSTRVSYIDHYNEFSQESENTTIEKEIEYSSSFTKVVDFFDPQKGFGMYGINSSGELTPDGYVDYAEIKNITFYAEYKDPEIVIKQELMSNGGFYSDGKYYQDINKSFNVSWEYNTVADHVIQETSIKVRIDKNGEDTQEWDVKDYTYSNGIGSVTIPEYIWRKIPCSGYLEITVVDNYGLTATKKMLFDVPYNKVEITKPVKDSILKFEEDNKIQWELKEVDGFQEYPAVSGYRVYLSYNEGATYDPVAEIVGDVREFTFPGGTLTDGILYVRVVAMYVNNTLEQNLRYGESRYIIKSDPKITTVSCDGKPIPTVSWGAVAQTSYQVKFGDYDSGAVYSSKNTHTVPYVFADGVYEVKVRTQNAAGEWSEWSEPIYAKVTNVPPELGITATAEKYGYWVKIVWRKNSGYADYILYRDGVPITVTDGGNSTDGGYIDKMTNGMSVYFVRGIKADGYYDQSDPVTVDASAKTDMLFAMGSDEVIPLQYTPVFPRKYNYASEMSVIYRWFAGRQKPISISSGQVSRSIPLSYIDKGRTLARKIAGMVGKTVVFKDSGGDMIVGVLNTVNAAMGRVSTTTFHITEVDYNERVAYLRRE